MFFIGIIKLNDGCIIYWQAILYWEGISGGSKHNHKYKSPSAFKRKEREIQLHRIQFNKETIIAQKIKNKVFTRKDVHVERGQ